MRREIYHCPITKISIVRTKGKAGYLVWKLAGGHGDQDINLPWDSLTVIFFCDFLDTELSVANPLLIVQNKIYTSKNKLKECLYNEVVFKFLLE